MSGDGGGITPIHFILMGNSKEHIDRAIGYFGIKQMVIFTSSDLYEENLPYIRGLAKKGIIVQEIKVLAPFTEDSLRVMSAEILKAYNNYSQNGNVTVIASLTGGTNLMVMAMGIFALIKGIQCYYLVKDDDRKILCIGLFKELQDRRSLDDIESFLLEGV